MNPFPYLGNFAGMLPIDKIIEYYKSIPYENWISTRGRAGDSRVAYQTLQERCGEQQNDVDE